jgi:hypothetical protein
MSFNPLNGFWNGRPRINGAFTMSLDERNQQINEALSGKYDQINALLAKHENTLRQMKTARNVQVLFNKSTDYLPTGEEEGEHREHLGFMKRAGVWRLCYAAEYESFICGNVPCDLEWKPLVECPVTTRVDAARHVGLLREAIVESKEEFLSEVDEAITELERSLANYDE